MNSQKKYVVVLGCYRSGSSCLSGVLNAMGVDFGKCIPPGFGNPKGFFENQQASRQLIRAFDQANARPTMNDAKIEQILINWRRSLDILPRFSVGFKHPLFCLMGKSLDSVFSGSNVFYVATERPVSEIVQSLQQCRWPWLRHANISSVVKNLLDSREQFLRRTPHISVDFHELINRTPEILSDLSTFLQLDVNDAQFDAACTFVQSDLIHSGG